MQSFKSTVPTGWDAAFILQRLEAAGVNNHYGYEIDQATAELRFAVLLDDADKLLAVIDSYQTEYLTVLRPRLKEQVSTLRKEKIKTFTFGGMTLELDAITESRIQGACLGLMLDLDKQSVRWDVGGLTFIDIPRDMMLALGKAAFNYVQACFDRSAVLGAALDAATTADEAMAIDLEAGWPE